MDRKGNDVSQVAVVSSCQMVRSAMRALFGDELAWQSASYEALPLQHLREHPVDLLILSLHVYHADLFLGIRLIQSLHRMHPRLRLLVALDVDMPYLVSLLQGYGVTSIINLRLSLTDWRQQLLVASQSEVISAICLPRACPFTTRPLALSPVESRIVHYLIQGLSVPEIAELMRCSIKAISSRKCSALHKMGIKHYAQLVAVGLVFIDSQDSCPLALHESLRLPVRRHHQRLC